MKQINLDNKTAKKVIELMNRGLAYTDLHSYRDYKSMEKTFELVSQQINDKKYKIVWNIVEI